MIFGAAGIASRPWQIFQEGNHAFFAALVLVAAGLAVSLPLRAEMA